MDKQSKKFSREVAQNPGDLSLEKRLQDLCLEEGITMRKVQNDMASFHLTLQFPNPQSTINIYQPKNKNDLVIIGSIIEVVEEHKEKIRQLSMKDREAFIWDLRLLLARGDTEFELQHPDNILEFVRIHKFLFEDGLSKHVFMNTLFDINRKKLLVIWFIQKRFGSSLTQKSEKGSPEDAFIYR